LIDCFSDIFPTNTAEQTDLLIQQYRRFYPARGHKLTRPYPGVAEALSTLGGRKSTATTKGTPTTRAVLEQFGLLSYFDHVQGTDGIPCKPAPDVLFTALKAIGGRPEECLMVGDSAADMEAARRAGVKVCAVGYGYGNPEELARWEPDFWVNDLRELVNGKVALR
jgi:HAD superfamily hydrolase (TIGR01509 family)